MLILLATVLACACALALYAGFYLTRYAFSQKRSLRFDRLCQWLAAAKWHLSLYAAVGGVMIAGIFAAVCLGYMGLYPLLMGYPFVLLDGAALALWVLLVAIAVLSFYLFLRLVIPLHLRIYRERASL